MPNNNPVIQRPIAIANGAPPATQPVSTTPKIDYRLPEYVAASKLWETIRDCIEGQWKVKERGTKYLPAIQPSDKTPANVDRNAAYAERAVFVGFTKRTQKGLVGQVFAKDPVLNVPTPLEPLRDSIDGSAVSFDQQAKQALSDNLAVGRAGILADYPRVEKPSVTVAEQAALKLRPTIQYYFAEQIINWRVEMVGGQRMTTLVVLEEDYTKKDDGFERELGKQWRVLRLVQRESDAKWIYQLEIYQKGDDGVFREIPGSPWIPTKANGQPFEEIPFHFIGSDNNDPGIDDPPMLDLANLNIAHYRNSADFEEMVYLLGQPTPWFAGLTQTWVNEVWKDGVALGGRGAIPLPAGGQAGLLQVSESQLALKALEQKERQAVALGARLVQENAVQRTATEAGMEESTELSVLQACAVNVASAYTRALQWCADFAGAALTAEHGYELNTDFDIATLGTEARRQLLAEWQAGAISYTELRDQLRRQGIATQDDEEAQAEIDAQTQKDAEMAAEALGSQTAAVAENTPAPPQQRPGA